MRKIALLMIITGAGLWLIGVLILFPLPGITQFVDPDSKDKISYLVFLASMFLLLVGAYLSTVGRNSKGKKTPNSALNPDAQKRRAG